MPVKRANTLEGGRCEHWIKPEHQTCVENVGARHTLFLVGGEYFKQGERERARERESTSYGPLLVQVSPEVTHRGGFAELHGFPEDVYLYCFGGYIPFLYLPSTMHASLVGLHPMQRDKLSHHRAESLDADSHPHP